MTKQPPRRQRHETPLAKWLRAANEVQRAELAELAETEVNYLYNLAAGRREPRLGLALRIERGTQLMARKYPTLSPVTVGDLLTGSAT